MDHVYSSRTPDTDSDPTIVCPNRWDQIPGCPHRCRTRERERELPIFLVIDSVTGRDEREREQERERERERELPIFLVIDSVAGGGDDITPPKC